MQPQSPLRMVVVAMSDTADRLHVGCGDRRLAGATNIDVRETAATDVVHDLTDIEWPIETASVDFILAEHVVEHLADPAAFFGECARVLRVDGRLEVAVPIGRDAHTDPDHEQVWQYSTPERFCGAQGWDSDLPFRIVDRAVDARLAGPLRPLSPLFDRLANAWPAWATYRAGEGELRVIFERVEGQHA